MKTHTKEQLIKRAKNELKWTTEFYHSDDDILKILTDPLHNEWNGESYKWDEHHRLYENEDGTFEIK